MFIPVFALPLVAQLIAVAGGVPALDVTQSCRGAGQASIEASRQDVMKKCLDTEHRVREKLNTDWSTFPAGDRALCSSSVGRYAPTYTELAACLERQRSLKAIKREPSEAVDGRQRQRQR
jgi:hypothetical protein